MLTQPAAATEWTPGDSWDLGSTSAPVGDRPFSGQMRATHEGITPNRLYVFVDEGGFLEARFAFAPHNNATAQATGVVRVTSPQGVQHEFEVDFGGQAQVNHYVTIEGTTLQSPTAGVWHIEPFFRGVAASGGISRFDVVPRDADGTVHQGRVWTYSYYRTLDGIALNDGLGSHRRLNPASATASLDARYVWDSSLWVWSPAGLLVRVDDMDYNGVHSVFSATSMGLVDEDCQPVRQSAHGQRGTWLPLSAACGIPFYRVFFEHPDLTMPAFAQYPDGSSQRINFPLTMPSIDSITYTQVGRGSVFDGQIAVTLSGQPTTVRVEIDTDGDGSFDGPGDRILFEEWTLLPGTTSLPWDGLDGNGLPVSLEQSVGVRVSKVSSFETHVIATDVEVRAGGFRMTALNGPLAGDPATRYLVNWDDRHPDFFDPVTGEPLCADNAFVTAPCNPNQLFPDSWYGVNVNSVNGVHRWNIAPGSTSLAQAWGDARNMVMWQVADVSDEATVVITGNAFEADLEITIEVPEDEDGELVLPVCPPAGDIELLVTVTNHGPDDATEVTVTLPEGTVLAEEQDHVTVNEGGDLVLVGDLEVDGYVTFYVISELSEDCGWDVTVSVEGAEYDPNLDNNIDTSTGSDREADLEIEIIIPEDEDGEQILPVCPPAGDIELLVTVTNHGPDDATEVVVTLPEGTVLVEDQDHVSVNEGGDLVLVGDLAVGDYVTFYVISELSEDCGWDVTVTVEGAEYDPNEDNNSSTSTGTIPGDDGSYPGLGGGEETPGTGNNGGDGTNNGDGPANGGNLGGGQDTPGTGGTGTGTPGGSGGAGAGSGVGTGVRAPGRLPLTGASGIWIAGAGLAVVGGLLLALNARKSKAATAAAE